MLQWLALSYSLAGQPDEALEAAGRDRARGDLGLDDIRANALSTMGITLSHGEIREVSRTRGAASRSPEPPIPWT